MKEIKMTNKKIIENYRKLKRLSKMCEENKIDYTNLVNNRTTEENEQIIANNIINEIIDFISEYYKKEI